MKKKPFLYVGILLFVVLALSVILYSYPILLGLNPFYAFSPEYSQENPTGGYSRKVYIKEDLISQVKADLPEGWKIKTQSYNGDFLYLNGELSETQEIKGLTDISIYNNDKLMSTIYAITEYGGLGNVLLVFPDSDPEVVKQMEENLKEAYEYTKREIKEGEYSEINLFGLEARRVDKGIIPNGNKEDNDSFIAPLDDLIFFPEEGPSYKVYYSGTLSTNTEAKYIITIEDITEEELEILDTIFNSVKLR